VLHTLYLAIAYIILFASAELMYHKLQFKAEVTRKYVHVLTGILSMTFPVLIKNHWLVLFLCASFLVILLSTMNSSWLRSIHGVKRKTKGSILYPIIVYGCYLAYDHFGAMIFYYTPILVLAISDPLAALVGKSFPKGAYEIFGLQKTLSGSSAFFLSALLLCLGLFTFLGELTFLPAFYIALSTAFLCTIAEAISHHGYDNFSIPAAALLVLTAFAHYSLFI